MMLRKTAEDGVGAIRCLAGVLAAILFALTFIAGASAQENSHAYVIGPSDVLEISFWQVPDLNSTVRVGDDSTITLPVIGQIRAAGLTTAQLSKNIVDQMAYYQTPVSQATVVVSQFNSRTVVVSGEVVTPSARSYERIPDLWRVIIDAGGPTEQADLSRVTIIRRDGQESRVQEVNLLNIIRTGDISSAPALHPGDLINIPATPFGVGIQLGEADEFEGRNVFFVLGSVTSPGVRNLEARIDVLDAITLAGGLTPEADLKNVRVIMKGPKYSKVLKIDLEKYINEGKPARYIIHPEDTVFVPMRRTGTFTSVIETVITIIPIVSAVGTIVLLTR